MFYEISMETTKNISMDYKQEAMNAGGMAQLIEHLPDM